VVGGEWFNGPEFRLLITTAERKVIDAGLAECLPRLTSTPPARSRQETMGASCAVICFAKSYGNDKDGYEAIPGDARHPQRPVHPLSWTRGKSRECRSTPPESSRGGDSQLKSDKETKELMVVPPNRWFARPLPGRVQPKDVIVQNRRQSTKAMTTEMRSSLNRGQAGSTVTPADAPQTISC